MPDRTVTVSEIAEHVVAIQDVFDASVVAILFVDTEGRPFLVPNPRLELGQLRLLLDAFGSYPWDASKST